MAKAIIMSGGSGGAASDECTALKGHVLAGKTAVTQDSGDEPAAGTMPERGNWNGSVGMNGSITIPEGHHAGSGRVTGPAVTQRGAWTSRLGINGRVAIPEGYHNGAGYVDQAIATQGALTLNPGTTAKTGAVSGKYMTGNITVPAVSIPANVIKKGHTVWFPDGSSVVGTFEGWVPGNNDLFYHGNKLVDIREQSCVFEGEYILVGPYLPVNFVSMHNVNCTGKKNLIIEAQQYEGTSKPDAITFQLNEYSSGKIITSAIGNSDGVNWFNCIIPLSSKEGTENLTCYLFMNHNYSPKNAKFRIRRIYLS